MKLTAFTARLRHQDEIAPQLPACIASECVNGVWRPREFEIPPGEPIPRGFHLARTAISEDGSKRVWVSYHGDPSRAPR